MYFVYSLFLALGFVLMLPAFLIRREKYAAGFRQRLGKYSSFEQDDRQVIWLHCVSVGEANAARPLVDGLIESFPDHRLILSTTTKTGHELVRKIFADKSDAIFYFPFDFRFSVRRALDRFKPSVVLLMETEIWPRFIREAKRAGAKVAIVNGRLSERSFRRYSFVRPFLKLVLEDVDAALMQGGADANRLISLGISAARAKVTGNLKFDQPVVDADAELTEQFRKRFGIDGEKLLILAASTHEPEEQFIVESLDGELGHSARLMIAPRHPERFDTVAKAIERSSYSFVRRTFDEDEQDSSADIILLDSIGELRSVYPLADIVFVGGSLIPHGGQSVFEPAVAGRPIVTGPFTHNFDAAVRAMLEKDALIQLPPTGDAYETEERLSEAFAQLADAERRNDLGRKAAAVMESGRGATHTTIGELEQIIAEKTKN